MDERTRLTPAEIAEKFEEHAQAEDAALNIAAKQSGCAGAILVGECHAAAAAYRRCASELREFCSVPIGAEDRGARN